MAFIRGLSRCTLAALLLSRLPVAACLSDKITFTYQSYMNDVNVWFTMFTLCLAPIVSHIALGLPKTVVMKSSADSADSDRPSKSSHPPWTERITLFNPVSIVWRYYAIAYFRLRNRSWDTAELAAVNAAFWDPTTRRWDGTEATILSARNYLTSPPETSHVKIVSGSTLATAILTMQGVQAIFFMIWGISGISMSSQYGFPEGLPYIFMPIGLLGLVRLPAAAWVSNEWGYDFGNSKREKAHAELLTFRNEMPNETFRISRKPVRGQYMELQIRGLPDTEQGVVSALPAERRQKLLDSGDWKCYVYRAWWIVSVVAFSALGVADLAIDITPVYFQTPLSVSVIAYLTMYLELCSGFLLITPILVLRRNHASTLIPCLQSWWYKLYTWLMILTALAALIFASLETVQLPNGIYMSRAPVNCYQDRCEPWNETAILDIARSEWERFFNISHIDA